MLDRVIVKVAFNCLDLVIEHESVDQERTDLTEKDRGNVLRVLCGQLEEDTLATSVRPPWNSLSEYWDLAYL